MFHISVPRKSYVEVSNSGTALTANGIGIDSSYNPSLLGGSCDMHLPRPLYQPAAVGSVYEYPMTVFQDRPRHLRHAQLGACSLAELKAVLHQAAERDWDAVILLSHGVELLDWGRTRPDRWVIRRFEGLCEFLARNDDVFRCMGFAGLAPAAGLPATDPLRSSFWRTGLRMIEQRARSLVS
jgi:hypothetical protein